MYVKILSAIVGILLFIFIGLATSYYVSNHVVKKTVVEAEDEIEPTSKNENSSDNKKKRDPNESSEKKNSNQSTQELGKNLVKEKMDDGREVIYGVVSDVGIVAICAQELDSVKGKYRTVYPQGKFIATTILVSNQQNDAITVNEGSYHLVDDKGREYSASSKALSTWSIGKDDGILGVLTEINPGNSQKFIFFFDVPENIDVSKLHLRARAGITGGSVTVPFNNMPEFSLLD